jgi:hypothetical protein
MRRFLANIISVLIVVAYFLIIAVSQAVAIVVNFRYVY